MGWTLGTDLSAHRAAAEPFLRADPVAGTIALTLLEGLATGARWGEAAPVFLIHRDTARRIDAVGVQTPPHPLLLDGSPADPDGLVAAFAAAPFEAVNASIPTAEAVARAWARRHGGVAQLRLRLHLLRLSGVDGLRDPGPPAGARVWAAASADLPGVTALLARLAAELDEPVGPPAAVRRRVEAGLLWLADVDGETVATANAGEPVAGVSRVAGVYTAPGHRGRGLAAAVTAAATRAAFARGAAAVCLFTDAANPTSNRVYERLGYVREPHDRLVLQLAT